MIDWKKGDLAVTASGQVVELQMPLRPHGEDGPRLWWVLSVDGHRAFSTAEASLRRPPPGCRRQLDLTHPRACDLVSALRRVYATTRR